jgi:hypothetical protein
MNEGGDFRIPKIFFFIMKYVTPVLLLCIMFWWFIEDAIPVFLLTGIEPDKVLYIWGARILMLVITAGILLMIRSAWKKVKTH